MRIVDMRSVVRNGESPDLVKFAVTLNGPEYLSDPPPVVNEWLWARGVKKNVYEVLSIPFFAKSFSRNDQVTCTSSPKELDGSLLFSGIVRHGGHSTYRIRLESEDQYSNDDKYSIWYHFSLLAELGCEFELGDFSLVAVDAGPSVKLGGVAFVLKSGFDDGIWDWQTGYIDSRNPDY